MLPVVILTSVFVFVFIRLVPGDPAVTLAGQRATPEQVAALRHNFGLDQPMVVAVRHLVSKLATGDFGTSYVTNRPVAELVLQRVPATVQLAVGALLVMLVFGVPLGIFCAVRPASGVSRVVAVLTSLALATPTFWLGILLVLFFAVDLHWLPASGFASITTDPVGIDQAADPAVAHARRIRHRRADPLSQVVDPGRGARRFRAHGQRQRVSPNAWSSVATCCASRCCRW